MKIWKVSTSAYCRQSNDTHHSVAFSSYEEARKCFDFYKENCILNNKYFKDHIDVNESYNIEYNDGDDWFYTLSLTESDVADKFTEDILLSLY